MRFLVTTLLLLSCLQLYSQTGNYFLSHYSPGNDRFDNVCFDMVQDERGLMYFATRSGVLEFDGRNWEMITGNGAVYSLQVNQKEIYWSGTAGYGKIDTNIPGNHKLKALSTEKVNNVFQCLAVRDKIYFASEQSIYIENKDQTIVIPSTNLTGSFGTIFQLFSSVYVNTNHGGIFKIEGDKLISSKLGLPMNTEVTFSSGYNNFFILGLSNSKVMLVGEDLHPKDIVLKDQAYADASVVVNGSWINRDLFVLSTLRGGLMFIQSGSGNTQEIINYNTGLPDNEVFAVVRDKSQCIWAAHEFGFTRVAPYLPFRSFSHYDGLAGNLLCATSFEGSEYVGTSLGLFKLEKEDIYDEISYFVDVEIQEPVVKTGGKKTAAKTEPVVAKQEPEQPVTNESKRKGFLSFFRRGKDKPKETPATVPNKNETVVKEDKAESAVAATAKPRYRSVRKTERVLRTKQYAYKKVQGINGKVSQLIRHNDQLIAAGMVGAFEVVGLTAKPILEEPVLVAYASANLNTLLLSTYSNEVRTFQPTDDGWKPLHFLDNLNERIDAMVDGVGQELWLCALDKAYRLDVVGGEVKNIQTVPVENPTLNNVVCIRWKNDVVLAHAKGFLKFDRRKNAFERMDSLSNPVNYFSDGENILFNNVHTWGVLGKARSQSNIQLINLLPNLRSVSIDQDTENLWVITGDNELYKFFGEKFTPYEAGNEPVLKAVRNGTTAVDLLTFEPEEDKSTLTFEAVQPDYLAPMAMEYRYRLKGLDKDWSEWATTNNVVTYPYLPANDYTLMVQARDIFGKVHDLSAVSFEVLPPYWRRLWFYALEFVVFAVLVLLSFRLSNRFRIISRLLSLLTIIMLIQFIQTIVSETFETKASPVTDFFVQVFVAFLILPVEGYLRNLMLQSLAPDHKLYKILTPKSVQAMKEKENNI
jgi:hypothetical protein